MNAVESCTVQILGRQYRFKHPAEQPQQLIAAAAELDLRLTAQANELPLATRDQLLVLTAINLLSELQEQQQRIENQLEQLLTQLK